MSTLQLQLDSACLVKPCFPASLTKSYCSLIQAVLINVCPRYPLRTEGVGSRREGVGLQAGQRSGDRAAVDSMEAGLSLVDTQAMMELGFTNLWKERGASGQRLKGMYIHSLLSLVFIFLFFFFLNPLRPLKE